MIDGEPRTASAPAGAPVRETVALLAAMLMTRGELAALELDDARRRAVRWGVLAVCCAVLALAALGSFALLVAAIFWDTYRWQALAFLVLTYAAAALLLAGRLRAELRDSPRLLEATLAELKRDGETLRSAWQ